MEQLIRQIAAVNAERQILLAKPEAFGSDKPARVRDFDARLAALFAQKRAMQVAMRAAMRAGC